MTRYEIRIARRDGQVLTVETRLMGDHAAIRRAQTLAMTGDTVEVWRGMACIFESADRSTVH